MKLLKNAQLLSYKTELYNKQNGICTLCKNPLKSITSSHLDHDHALNGNNAGRCRGLLCPQCNILEGTIKHKFNRSGLKGKVVYLDYLRNLLNYLEQDYSDNLVHPRYVPDKVKSFGMLKKPEMEKLLGETGTKEKLTNIYKGRLIKSLE